MEISASIDRFNVFTFCQDEEEEPLGAALSAAMQDPAAELGLPLASVAGFCRSLDGKLAAAAAGSNIKASRTVAVDSMQLTHLLIMESGEPIHPSTCHTRKGNAIT